jgi:hypothetical protein
MGFKLPDWLPFNARSDSLTTSPFWKDHVKVAISVEYDYPF